MYGIHKQVHTPTGIEHCVYCNFFSPRESNLVVAGATQLRVYRFITLDETKPTEEGPDEVVKKRKFELAGQYQVFGNIQSINAVRLAGNSRESLLLSFSDAKLSIVEYDPTTHDLKTVSLHYFEDDKQLKNGRLQNLCLPKVRVDPERRCAAMLAYSNHLIILPFRQEGVMDEHSSTMSTSDRSCVLSSYMIDMRLLDEKVTNIIDFQFLHGYYEPTILIIYEPVRTCPGRLAIRQDTCALVAISLNMSEKVNPVIWSLSNLPFDCLRVEPVPKPLGGVLVFATNSMVYLNQSVPPYGVRLNNIADHSTQFQLRLQEGVVITLDGSQSAFIGNDKLVLSLRGGEIYVLTLVSDGMRGIRGFNFDKAASSVLTSCMCQCGEGYLFLGSRLGNSLLLKYTEKMESGLFDVSLSSATEEEQPQNKKRKLEYENPYALDDIDELEVYGSEKQSGTQLTSYAFEVCDSLLNIGPCTCVDMGEPAFISEEFTSNVDADLELVTCSGFGKNGALSVLQRSVRPQVVTTFELADCTDMWTVLCSDQEDAVSESEVNKKGYHSFLILGKVDSSMVLKTEQEIMELDHSGFSTQYPTVFAGNVGKDNYIIQVVPLGVRLLKGVEQIQHIPMDAGFSAIVWCSLTDPYAVLLTVDGIVILVEFNEESDSGPRLTVSKPPLIHGPKVCACCLYKDISGLMSTEKVVVDTTTTQQQATVPQPRVLEPDDEDELLYGESMPSMFSGDEVKPEQTSQESTSQESSDTESTVKPTYWCVLCHENGVLEIYSVPDFKLVFLVNYFNMAPRVLVDSGQSTTSASSSSSMEEGLVVKEILLTGMGYKNSKPLLFAMVDQDLLIYEAFKYNEGIIDGNLNLRFKKLHHNMIIREKKSRLQKNKMQMEAPLSPSTPRVATFRPFSDVSSYSGVFVCGSYPYWLFMTSRGALRAHPMTIDGPVSSFAPFHNINCPKGFLFFNKLGELRISVLPTHLSYDAPWPVRKVPLRATPHFAAYNRESKTFAVVSSQRETCKKICRQGPEEREFEDTDKGPRFIYPLVDKFSIQLISPVSWEAIPNTKFEFDEFEHVTTMKNLLLRSEETHTGLKGFIAVGSTYVYGEDIQCKGRICIYDIIEVVPEPGQPLTKNKLKLLYGKEQKGPVTALEHIRGYILSAIGQKIYIWNFKDNQDLVGMAFIDTQLYIHTAVSVKNFVIVADIHKSITLLRFQEETKTLAHVSRDHGYMEVYSANYVVDGPQLGILASDSDKNLILYQYQPEALESMGGQKLLQRADIHLGSHVTAFFRIRVKGGRASEASKMKDMRQATYFGTLDGGMGLILPMPEKTYRRLLMLQSKLVESIPHLAGLNPRAFRLLKWPRRPLSNPHRNILDSELLMKFLHLGVMERTEVAKKIGTTPAQILDDLMDVERATSHF